jgi:hypothetical protein
MGLCPTVKAVLIVAVTAFAWCFQPGYAGGPPASALSAEGKAERP